MTFRLSLQRVAKGRGLGVWEEQTLLVIRVVFLPFRHRIGPEHIWSGVKNPLGDLEPSQ
jgi:hypothetical protein